MEIDFNGNPINHEAYGYTKPTICAGTKYDSGKPPMGLISSVAQTEEAKVLAFGAQKYDAHNWRGGMKWSRVYDAVQRHLVAWNAGEDIDPETGLSHLAHARCGLGFLIDYSVGH